MNNKKIFHLVTVSKSIPLMKGQIEYLRDKGLDVHIVSSEGEEQKIYPSNIVHVINMEREISIKNDIKSLYNMIKLFIKEKPQIVNSGTPKAGLIGTLAAFITRRPVRMYTVRGLRLETVTGLKYKILYAMEKLAMFCATDVIAISESLKKRIVSLGLEKKENISVLGYGSSNGINLDDYNKNDDYIPVTIANQLENHFVIGYVGRIVKDKGIREVVEVFKILKLKGYLVKLLVVGEIEEDDSIDKKYFNFLESNDDVILTGQVNKPVCYYNHMDVLLFPTYREGFGNVSIEAQAVEVPVITSNATGAQDTVDDEQTGFIVDIGDYKAMANKTETLMNNEILRQRLGTNARVRVAKRFKSEIVWKHLETIYRNKNF
ncbi:glycosyltransferase family 4 protein [Staphylococcus saccharolyticus]|uniref:glycosyltransferase family 4 protein n=1 Tax=Staphylococcus saccharolyticus TaxID=33028 RepID=UPI000E1BEE98|nr:glycosyltransferase family 4 protein [Staphylococcus saccharolyticus]MBL7571104.1 glycosyltransferase family 4 protein [Staphylococcus saccharolyticus]QQB99319.1 glycosyltransferase family 4 protein [Staphylococcus saccharolyticus]QRJ67468.1 glycosyltransferase family 4 protein [Staphylococcus saccharolyticus]RTX98443.1 glycosyltransferase family 1 protein [Staphylococcus saccharolyticus]